MLQLALALTVFADPAPSLLQATLQKYQTAQSVSAKIEKSVKHIYGRVEKAEGRLYLAKGKMRLELDDDLHTTMILDGESFWIVQSFDGQPTISQFSSERIKKSDNILGALLSDGKFLKTVEVTNMTSTGDVKTCEISPKSLKNLELKTLSVGIRSNALDSIAYSDELENKTTYVFKSISLNDHIDSEKFRFKPPKGAQISHF
jgi:chaperone LolA